MTDNIVWSTLENAISMGGRRATLRKPLVSLPRPLHRLGHITSGYLASCLRHFAQILATLGLQIPAKRYTQFGQQIMKKGGKCNERAKKQGIGGT